MGLKAYVIPAFIYHRSQRTNANKLFTYQIRLFNKHKKFCRHIYAKSCELSMNMLDWRFHYKILYSLYVWLFPPWIKYLKRDIQSTDTVLDLGCGSNSPLQYCQNSYSVGVEIFAPYLDESKEKTIHTEYINADILEVNFPPKSFDIVLASEVLEHLSKKDASDLIRKMEIWARRKIIVTTPNGFTAQDDYDSNQFQKHLCGWNLGELENIGFKVHGINGCKKLVELRGSTINKPGILWRIMLGVSQCIVYHYPKLAFQLLAVKELKNNAAHTKIHKCSIK